MTIVDLPKVNWHKSSYSVPSGDCVEAGHLQDGRVAVRDSKNPNAGVLVFPPAAWDAFLADTRRSTFDHQ